MKINYKLSAPSDPLKGLNNKFLNSIDKGFEAAGVTPVQFLQGIIDELNATPPELIYRMSNLSREQLISGLVDVACEKASIDLTSPTRFAQEVDAVLDYVSEMSTEELREFCAELCFKDVRHSRFFC